MSLETIGIIPYKEVVKPNGEHPLRFFPEVPEAIIIYDAIQLLGPQHLERIHPKLVKPRIEEELSNQGQEGNNVIPFKNPTKPVRSAIAATEDARNLKRVRNEISNVASRK